MSSALHLPGDEGRRHSRSHATREHHTVQRQLKPLVLPGVVVFPPECIVLSPPYERARSSTIPVIPVQIRAMPHVFCKGLPKTR